MSDIIRWESRIRFDEEPWQRVAFRPAEHPLMVKGLGVAEEVYS